MSVPRLHALYSLCALSVSFTILALASTPVRAGGQPSTVVDCSGGSEGPVDAATQEAIKDAVWEYTLLEEQAGQVMDAAVLSPIATEQWIDEMTFRFGQLRRQGVAYIDSPRLDIEFRRFTSLGQGCVEVDLVLIGSITYYDAQERVLLSEPPERVPQIDRLILENGKWKFDGGIFLSQ